MPKPRLPRFTVEDAGVPAEWFDGDPCLTAAWSALSVILCVGERLFVDTGKWVVL